jgi:hypothetical protein
VFVVKEMLDIAPRAGKEVVDAKDLVAAIEKRVSEVRP